MVRLNRIYTRSGDAGTTMLASGQRVPKEDPRIAAYGTVDELNAVVGLVRERGGRHGEDEQAKAMLDGELARVQQRLFDLGASLASRPSNGDRVVASVPAAEATHLETLMDKMNEELPPLESFVLPGGGPVGAMLHLARTVCRRAEREAFALSRLEAVEADDLRYLNRLSDAFFVMGRWVALRQGEPETLWLPGGESSY